MTPNLHACVRNWCNRPPIWASDPKQPSGKSRSDMVYQPYLDLTSDAWFEQSGFSVRDDQAAIIFSFIIGIVSRKVCNGVLPKHHRP